MFLPSENFISVAAVLYLLPPPARGDVSSCWASLVCLFSLSWYTCGFYTRCHAAGGPSGVPLLADSGWLLYSCGWFRMGLGVVLSQLYCSSLVFFFVPAQLPLRGSAPLQGRLACLSPVCWSTLWCGWRGLAATFSSVPVRCFPCCRYIEFSGLLLLRLLAGVVVALHPVSGCSSCGVVCLVCRWDSPAAFSLP